MKNNLQCLAVSDLHGRLSSYIRLFKLIAEERPAALFLAGDLTGGYFRTHLGEDAEEFFYGFLAENFRELQGQLAEDYPAVFAILGNDDPRYLETACRQLDEEGLWHYVHNRCLDWQGYTVCGYSYVPPTPFQLKDWEKYDVSRYVDVGAIAPSGGFRTVEVRDLEVEWGTIKHDLEQLYKAEDLSRHICLFHSPPYQTSLDRAGLDGKMVDHAPVDVHVGSIAIKNFIERRQPLLTIHGHVHESTSLTGSWQDKIGETVMFNPAHHKPELSVIRFDPRNASKAERVIL